MGKRGRRRGGEAAGYKCHAKGKLGHGGKCGDYSGNTKTPDPALTGSREVAP